MICNDTSGMWPRIVMLVHRVWGPSVCCRKGITTIPEIMLSVCCVVFLLRPLLARSFDSPGLSVAGNQPCNRWFVHTDSQSNIMTWGPWLNHANGSVQITLSNHLLAEHMASWPWSTHEIDIETHTYMYLNWAKQTSGIMHVMRRNEWRNPGTKLAPEWRPSDQKPSTLPLDYGAHLYINSKQQ